MATHEFYDSFETEYAKVDITVTSPDGCIKARIVGGVISSIQFKPGVYKQYTEPALEHQLVQLARLGNAARTRGYRQVLEKVLGHGEPIDARGPGTPQERALREEADRTEIETKSRHFKIHVRGGVKDWQLRIRPGTIQQLDEEEFLRELSQTLKRTISEWQTALNEMRLRNIGPSEILKGLRYMKKEPSQ